MNPSSKPKVRGESIRKGEPLMNPIPIPNTQTQTPTPSLPRLNNPVLGTQYLFFSVLSPPLY